MPNERDQHQNFENIGEEASRTSNRPTSKKRMPWNSKFGEDENFKNRQYSRTVRNQPAKEATTLSKVLLFLVVLAFLTPFLFYWIMNMQRNDDNITARTASQIAITRSENSEAQTAETKETSEKTTANESSSESATSQEVAETNQTQESNQQTQNQTGGSYTVNQGDSWYAIARAHGVDVYALAQANGATINTPLAPGQVIKIPGQ
ncbi:LysM peptidoglycan-binding domain-containing protein [Vaginisenegalia massiliensis]|uniref:LysM peptidoglycan-binding domain-containing protein n=1 Tax=Vaginisenegalia massiliensis TaxID=2058294 RepID=UPI000F544D1E|nr:LysM peptidoglycan-binding domain-containing protein [Vaginisenegalia massiliensis]